MLNLHVLQMILLFIGSFFLASSTCNSLFILQKFYFWANVSFSVTCFLSASMILLNGSRIKLLRFTLFLEVLPLPILVVFKPSSPWAFAQSVGYFVHYNFFILSLDIPSTYLFLFFITWEVCSIAHKLFLH